MPRPQLSLKDMHKLCCGFYLYWNLQKKGNVSVFKNWSVLLWVAMLVIRSVWMDVITERSQWSVMINSGSSNLKPIQMEVQARFARSKNIHESASYFVDMIYKHALFGVQACGRPHWCPKPDILTFISLLFFYKDTQWGVLALMCKMSWTEYKVRKKSKSKWLIRRNFLYFI